GLPAAAGHPRHRASGDERVRARRSPPRRARVVFAGAVRAQRIRGAAGPGPQRSRGVRAPSGEADRRREPAGGDRRALPALIAQRRPSWARAASIVFESRYAMVIGPTPPGTGVIARARSAALANSTSPTSLPAALRFMPTSMTVDPGFTQSP